MKKIVYVLTLLLISMGMYQCARKNKKSEILNVVNANIEALKQEDIEGVKATMRGSDSLFALTIKRIEHVFQQYDLAYTIENMHVIEVQGNSARVWFIQKVEKINGPSFRDNKLTGIHTLNKIDGTWYITDTEVVDVSFLGE